MSPLSTPPLNTFSQYEKVLQAYFLSYCSSRTYIQRSAQVNSSTEQGPDISALCDTWCEKNYSTKKMQNVTENIMGTLLPPQAPSNVVQRSKNQRYGKKKSTTYLGLIAYVIQDSPDKMLTFTQVKPIYLITQGVISIVF